jgi:hypothetical protein
MDLEIVALRLLDNVKPKAIAFLARLVELWARKHSICAAPATGERLDLDVADHITNAVTRFDIIAGVVGGHLLGVSASGPLVFHNAADAGLIDSRAAFMIKVAVLVLF